MDAASKVLLACSVGDLRLLKEVLSEGTAPTVTDGQGFNGMHLSAKNGDFDCLKYLLNNTDIDINAVTKGMKMTPLHCSLMLDKDKSKQYKCMKLLLEGGADHSIKDVHCQTVLHYAVRRGCIKCVKLLLDSGVDMHAKDDIGKTAYDVACINNHYECARLLRALHWANRKDIMQNKKVQEEEFQRRRGNVQSALQTRLQSQKADAAYKDWLSENNFNLITSPQECKKRQENRILRSSLCTACCTPASKHLSAAVSHYQSKTVVPIKVVPHQKERNLETVGKPDKMQPYTNYYTQKPKKLCRVKVNKRSTFQSLSGQKSKSSASTAGIKFSCVKKFEKNKNILTRRGISHPATLSDSNQSNLPSSENVTGNCNEFVTYTHMLDKTNHDNSSQEHPSYSQDQPDEVNFFEQSDVLLPQNNFDFYDTDATLFHEVGELNDLQSLFLPAILTKSRTPAEVLQLLRHLGNSESNKRSHRRSYSVSHGIRQFSGKLRRRFSLGCIPEGRIVTDYTEDDEDNIDSQVLKNLKNSIESVSGTEEVTEDAPCNDHNVNAWPVEEEHFSDPTGGVNIVNMGEKHLAGIHYNLQVTQSSSPVSQALCNTNGDEPLVMPHPKSDRVSPSHTLKVINLAWDESSNSVKTHVCETNFLSPATRIGRGSAMHRNTGLPSPRTSISSITSSLSSKTSPSKTTPPSNTVTPHSVLHSSASDPCMVRNRQRKSPSPPPLHTSRSLGSLFTTSSLLPHENKLQESEPLASHTLLSSSMSPLASKSVVMSTSNLSSDENMQSQVTEKKTVTRCMSAPNIKISKQLVRLTVFKFDV